MYFALKVTNNEDSSFFLSLAFFLYFFYILFYIYFDSVPPWIQISMANWLDSTKFFLFHSQKNLQTPLISCNNVAKLHFIAKSRNRFTRLTNSRDSRSNKKVKNSFKFSIIFFHFLFLQKHLIDIIIFVVHSTFGVKVDFVNCANSKAFQEIETMVRISFSFLFPDAFQLFHRILGNGLKNLLLNFYRIDRIVEVLNGVW